MGLRFSKSDNSIATFKILNFDSDAQAFITAAGITNTTQQDAINKLTIDLKYFGLWNSMKAIYPFVGGTATTHKFNLKNPLDTNAAFRLLFIGGGTHSSTGYNPGGVNGYADTFLIPSTALLLNSVHLSYYCRSNNLANIHMGVDSAPPNAYLYQAYGASLGLVSTLNTNSFDYIDNIVANSLGLSISSRTTSTNVALYKSGVKLKSDIKSSATLPVLNIALGARNASGVISNFDNKECAFSSIGDGLTDEQALNFYNIVQQYQTNLSRQV